MNTPHSASHQTARRGFRWARAVGLAFCLAVSALGASAQTVPGAERRGAIPTRDALELTLTADRGSVRIFSGSQDEVRYRVTLEPQVAASSTPARLDQLTLNARDTQNGVVLDGLIPPGADFQNVWVKYELHVPRRYNLRITTGAGDIRVSDIEGRVVLITGGGNIEAAHIGADASDGAARTSNAVAARLETGGGNISVAGVAGALRAVTGGGHISAGEILGDAVLQTGGGNIRVASVSGSARLTTGGGNIYAGRTGGGLVAETAGGRIDLGEVTGAIRTRTDGPGRALRLEAQSANSRAAPASRIEQGAAARPSNPRLRGTIQSPQLDLPSPEMPDGPSFAAARDLPLNGPFAQWSRAMESLWWGGVRVDPADQQKRLIRAPAPEYPEAARRARIAGQVTLGLRIGADGSVEEATLLSGEPVLGRAAMEAVEQWRYAPLRIGGRPVSILTTVTLAFELR
jgi:TonB family protein